VTIDELVANFTGQAPGSRWRLLTDDEIDQVIREGDYIQVQEAMNAMAMSSKRLAARHYEQKREMKAAREMGPKAA
jgi:hypothetical protein